MAKAPVGPAAPAPTPAPAPDAKAPAPAPQAPQPAGPEPAEAETAKPETPTEEAKDAAEGTRKEKKEEKEDKKEGTKKGAKAAEEGEAAEGEGAGGGGAAGVKLLMPEPPSEPSPATKKRIRGVQGRAGKTAVAKSALPPGGDQVKDARASVDEPSEEAKANAAKNLIALLDEEPKPSPEIEKLAADIRKVIEGKRPVDEDALAKAEPAKEAAEAGNTLNASVESDTKKVQDNYAPIGTTPEGASPAQGAELQPQPEAAATPGLNAKAATPDAVPDQNVSLDADVDASKKKMEDAGMEKPTAQLVQSGPIAEARAAQGELEQTAKEEPGKVLAGQQEKLAKAEGDMAALQAKAVAALTASRGATTKGAAGQQTTMIGSEESQRAQVGTAAQNIFNETKNAVKAQLDPLPGTAMRNWEAAKKLFVLQFKEDLAVVQKRVDDRHSGVGGFFVGLWDAATGLPDWAIKGYDNAERRFAESVIAKIREISTEVNGVILVCEALIKSARERITELFAKAKTTLGDWADQEAAKFDKQLDKLRDEARSTRDNFNKELVNSSAQAVDEVRTEIAELRKKAGGLLGRIVDAIGRFIDDPIKFIIEGLLDLLGIPPASFWAVVAKIKKVIGEIADDPMKFANNLMEGLGKGFSQFFDNFPTHLFKGFISWLTGGLSEAGVELPKDLSLKSIITFFLQLMGITWPRIRKVLAKHIGEKNVALLEKVYSLVSFLIEKGPEGIFEMIREKLNPQSLVDQVIQLAIDFMISAIVKAATARILMLFNPAGAILQALEAIYRVLKWVFQNAAKIFTLIETVVNGIADILAGSIGGFANAIEKALAGLIAPVIAFIADYFGFGDLPQMIAEKIKSFQEWIMGLVEKVLVFFIEKGKALLAAVGLGGKKEEKKKEGGEDVEGVGEMIQFSADGQPHSLWLKESGGGVVVMVKSDATPVEKLLAQFEEKVKGKNDRNSKAALKLIGDARTKVAATEKEGKEELAADAAAQSSAQNQATVNKAVQAHTETVAKEESLGETLGRIFTLVHGGANVLGLLDQQIILRGVDSSDKIKDQDAVNQMTAAKYVVYPQTRDGNDRYYVRRSDVPEDESERPQVHFTERTESDAGGRLALGGTTAKADDSAKIAVYDQLLKLVGLKPRKNNRDDADKYREEARPAIVQALVKGGRAALLEFMDESKKVPPSYNRLRGDIYDEWMIAAGVRTYKRPGPIFVASEFDLHQDRQPDGTRGKTIYDAKGHQGRGPSGEEKRQYADYLKIIKHPESGFSKLVYIILDHEARSLWENSFPEASFGP